MRNNRLAKLIMAIHDPYNGEIAQGTEISIEGLWHELTGGSWMSANGNPAAMNYAMRGAFAGLPIDDNVYYGKINGLGFLVHETELEFV